MTIRTTVNQSIMRNVKYNETTPLSRDGQTYELVATTAAPGGVEARDIDARAAGQTATPANRHNGPVE